MMRLPKIKEKVNRLIRKKRRTKKKKKVTRKMKIVSRVPRMRTKRKARTGMRRKKVKNRRPRVRTKRHQHGPRGAVDRQEIRKTQTSTLSPTNNMHEHFVQTLAYSIDFLV
jgi:hypothetical protein